MKKNSNIIITMILCIAMILSACGIKSSESKNQTSGVKSDKVVTDGLVNSKIETSNIIVGTSEAKVQLEGSMEDIKYGFVLDDSVVGGKIIIGGDYPKWMQENTFRWTSEEAVTTFSADVDTASYSKFRYDVMNTYNLYGSYYRIEEMINYFDYEYSYPTDDSPFSVHMEASDTPWNNNTKLVLIGIQGKEIQEDLRPKNNLVFLIDVSGSMQSEEKLPLVKQSLELVMKELSDEDRISIVTYSGKEQVLLNGIAGNESKEILRAIHQLEASGSTNGEAGLTMAYDIASKYYIEDGNNRIIMATDGDLNVGISSSEELKTYIEGKREKGIFLSVLGYGINYGGDDRLEHIADYGNGTYSYIDSIREAKKVLIEELDGTLYTIAKDLKLQIEFNQEMIKGYRLIGYENRMLNNEDFENDKKDAGDIGSGHQVTALYEVIIQDDIEIENDNKTIDRAETEKQWFRLNLRYKEANEDMSKLITKEMKDENYNISMSNNLRFASSVAGVGMIVNRSAYSENLTIQDIQRNLLPMIEDMDEYKKEFYSLLDKIDGMIN